MKRKTATASLIFILTTLIFSTSAPAVNFYDGARAKKGTYFLTYTSLYLADEVTDSSGQKAKSDYGLTRVDEILRLCYYSPDSVATALLPLGYMETRSVDQESSGLGDVILGAGHFLPIKSVDLLPMVFLKLPTGEYEASKSVNVGSNQYDIRPTVFLYKAFGDYSVDAAAKYFFRMKNPDTKVTPGDELHLQLLLGYKPTEKLKFGPSVNWMMSRDKQKNGIKVADSAREVLSAGADVYYRIGKVGVTFTYLYDVYAENSTKGHFFQFKTCYLF